MLSGVFSKSDMAAGFLAIKVRIPPFYLRKVGVSNQRRAWSTLEHTSEVLGVGDLDMIYDDWLNEPKDGRRII